MNEHEEKFARFFIVPEKRDRYLSLLESARGRRKVLNGFNHCRDLDPRFAREIPSNEDDADSVARLLRKKGAPDQCYVMSDNDAIDGQVITLTEALEQTVGADSGTLISCIPGKLAYFEMEIDGRYILER
jgi:hypothetical protein